MKLPFFQLFPSDYMRDTRALSLAAKGAWMDILCMLHGSDTRGRMVLPIAGWARVIGASEAETDACLKEIGMLNVGLVERDGNGNVTVSSRRMLKEHITREQTRLRVANHRSNARKEPTCNAKLTDKKSETRSQKSESEEGSLRSPSCAEPENSGSAAATAAPGQAPVGPMHSDPVTDAIAMNFPTVGTITEWPLRTSKVAEYRLTFPGVDVDAALREARQWCLDNPARRKTAKGMQRFLFAWIERRQNRASSRGGEAATPSMFAGRF